MLQAAHDLFSWLDSNDRYWEKLTIGGGKRAKFSGPSYFKRMRVGPVGTVQITPPLPNEKRPLLWRPFSFAVASIGELRDCRPQAVLITRIPGTSCGWRISISGCLNSAGRSVGLCTLCAGPGQAIHLLARGPRTRLDRSGRKVYSASCQ